MSKRILFWLAGLGTVFALAAALVFFLVARPAAGSSSEAGSISNAPSASAQVPVDGDYDVQPSEEPVACTDLSDSARAALEAFGSIRSVSADAMVKSPSASFDEVVQPYFGGDIKTVKIVQLFALGAQVDECSFSYSEDGAFSAQIVGSVGDSDGPSDLMEISGYYVNGVFSVKSLNENMENYGAFFSENAETVGSWPT